MRTVLDLVLSSQASGRKPKKTSCVFLSSKRLERRKSGGTHRFSEEQDLLAMSSPPLHCNQEEWLKELEDTSSINEAEGQTTTSASHMKLLENGRDSKTSTTGESSVDVDIEISSFGFTRHGFKKCLENEEAKT